MIDHLYPLFLQQFAKSMAGLHFAKINRFLAKSLVMPALQA